VALDFYSAVEHGDIWDYSKAEQRREKLIAALGKKGWTRQQVIDEVHEAKEALKRVATMGRLLNSTVGGES
jgi:hypothetical protein